MSERRLTPPPNCPNEADSFRDYLRRTARTTAGPVLLVWLIVSMAEFALAEWFAGSISYLRLGPWWDVPSNLRGWALAPIVAMFLPLLAAYRTALFRPARQVFCGKGLTFGEVADEAFERVLSVFSTRMTITSAQIGALLLCSWLVVPMPFLVVLSIGFAMVPALYVASTRRVDSNEALSRGLEWSRRHWVSIHAAHGLGLTVVSLFTAGGFLSVAYGAPSVTGVSREMTVLAAYLTGRYLDWVVVTSTYLYLDEEVEV